MALITTVANAYGARWFDEKWQPEFTGPEWKNALNFYVDTMKKSGPPGASSNGFNENLALFNSGKCAIWVDASVAGSFVTDKTQSKVATTSASPTRRIKSPTKARPGCIPGRWRSRPAPRPRTPRKTFSAWATSKEYGALVAEKDGIANVPPGTRASTYSEAYMKRRAVRQGHAGIAESGGPEQTDAQAGAVHRHSVGDHS